MMKTIPFVSQCSKEEEQDWIKTLAEKLPGEVIVPFAALTDQQKEAVEIAIVANPKPEEVAMLPNLKWVHSVWAGVERLLADLGDRPFDIVRLVDPELGRTMAEAVLAWTLYLHRDMPSYAKFQKQREWVELPYIKAADKTVGIIGLGALGQASAKILGDFGFRVAGWSRSQKDMDGVQCYSGPDGLYALAERSDILVCLLPLTNETTGLLDGRFFACGAKGKGFINFGRGAVVKNADLLTALDKQYISHAVLDVFEQEPLPPESEWWGHEKVTVLPHISAPTDIDTASTIVAENIQTYRQSGVLPPVVNKKRGY
ncbi:2-hydroxyacid dehydrogenase [Sneathiella aquimaris]|uniref:2-hydroxyacid dehydrogenase n=1 Tax=Sneathiella aquimaris TaxID=2599305 RepID=UPI00146B4F4E|nr:glyoxylate/hydroxypyruvate reductase A [Sneathiella aquimaris]